MSISVGIVGLPNVGKSTLFNALTNLNVEAANYPFATIEPNTGVVPVPDERLGALAKLENSKEIIPTIIEFRDIAGLVAGAHKGEGLGNQFLSHIREVDAIVEVVRFFDDENIIHVSGKVDPERDIETIETELVLADLELVEKKLKAYRSAAKTSKKEELIKLSLAEKYYQALSKDEVGSAVQLTDEEKKYQHEFPLLTNKPILYVANVKSDLSLTPSPSPGEGNSRQKTPLPRRWGEAGREVEMIWLDAQLESEISQLPENERKDYLKELGLPESGLDKLIGASYKLLNLITFFTAGEKETRAWTGRKGMKAPQAAGIIHTDFEKGFIKAEIIDYLSLINAGSYSSARDKGLIRTEGREYTIQDGDVVHFRFNV